jgi:hypothetical protein
MARGEGRPSSLVLTLPPDPSLARLTRLVALHFLRQNGLRPRAARRSARLVARRCLVLLGPAGRARRAAARRPLTIVLTPRTRVLEVSVRPDRPGGSPRPLARIPRPAAP